MSWGTSTGTVTSYQLYEANNSSFSGESLVHSDVAASYNASGKGNGTYYYRVRACNSDQCSAHRADSNGILVRRPPSAPSSITVPATNNTGSITISWGTATGTLTAYQLYEATNSSFSGQTLVHNAAETYKSLSRSTGTYYYRVRACYHDVCSGYAPGAHTVVITIPPGAPSSISIPLTNNTGNYTISWATASGAQTYELYEATNSGFSGAMLVPGTSGTSASLSGRDNGSYYYRVRACNAGGCSGYRTGGNAVGVTLPPGTPSSLSAPATNTSGNIEISWGVASGTLSAYELYEATNSGFSGATLVYGLGGKSTTLVNRLNGTYYYRVRACYNTVCSGYTPTAITVVTLTIAPPTGLTYSQNSQCSYRATWSASSGATSYTIRDWSGSFNYSVSGTEAVYSFCDAPGYSGNPYDYRPKWVKACNSSTCSSQANFP